MSLDADQSTRGAGVSWTRFPGWEKLPACSSWLSVLHPQLNKHNMCYFPLERRSLWFSRNFFFWCVCACSHIFTRVWRPEEDIGSYPSGDITVLFYLVTGYLTGWNSPNRLNWLDKEQKKSAHVQSPDHHAHPAMGERPGSIMPSHVLVCPGTLLSYLPIPSFLWYFLTEVENTQKTAYILFIFTWMRSKSWNNVSEAHLFHSNHRSFPQGTKIWRSYILSKWIFSLSIMLLDWFIVEVISICSKI